MAGSCVANVLEEEERLANAVADGSRPAMTPEINIVTHTEKTLLVVFRPHPLTLTGTEDDTVNDTVNDTK